MIVLYISLLLLSSGILPPRVALGMGERLPLENPTNPTAFIRNDTITVITRGENPLLFEIVDGRVVNKVDLGIIDNSRSNDLEFVRTPSSFACLHESADNVWLYEWPEVGAKRVVYTGIPAPGTSSRLLIPWGNSRIIVFSDHKKRFTLNSHSLSIAYRPLAYCAVINGASTDVKPIESGRASSNGLKYTIFGNRIYAVWVQCRHETFMTWLTDIRVSLVFSVFDGSSWSRPEAIYDVAGIPGRSATLLGLYELKGQLYCLWYEREQGDTSDVIRYMKSSDQKHWTSPADVVRCSGFVNSWLACTDGHDRIHIIISDSKRSFPTYASFDGIELLEERDLDIENAYLGSLSVDQGQTYLFYSKWRRTAASTEHTNKEDDSINSEEGAARVRVIKTDQMSDEVYRCELYVMRL